MRCALHVLMSNAANGFLGIAALRSICGRQTCFHGRGSGCGASAEGTQRGRQASVVSSKRAFTEASLLESSSLLEMPPGQDDRIYGLTSQGYRESDVLLHHHHH